MAILGTFSQQPIEELDYDLNYEEWLSNGDYVASSNINVTPSGLSVTGIITDSGRRIKLWVLSGTAGVTYKVEITATTALARVKQDEVLFRIKEV